MRNVGVDILLIVFGVAECDSGVAESVGHQTIPVRASGAPARRVSRLEGDGVQRWEVEGMVGHRGKAEIGILGAGPNARGWLVK